jgi:inward rectifier potassium channel
MSSAPTRTGPPPAPAPSDQPVRVIGGARTPLRDFYHAFLRMPWWAALAMIVVVYLALNALFALAFLWCGGIANAKTGSFSDAFFFSVQTMGTIGYGAMYPTTRLANWVMVAESVAGLIVTALATGLVFAKFSQSSARIVFTSKAAIGPMNGVPTLMIRLGNERKSRIMEAQLRVVVVQTERTAEGMVFYRMKDLPLTRDRSPAMSRSWTVLHPITDQSPLHGLTPASLKALEAEIMVTVVGTDDTSLQPVHAQKTYPDQDVVWGARHADILHEEPDGSLTLDLRRFHDLVPTKPTPDFPYPN